MHFRSCLLCTGLAEFTFVKFLRFHEITDRDPLWLFDKNFGYLITILHLLIHFDQNSEKRDKQASREGLVGTPGQRGKIRDDPGKYGTSGHPVLNIDQ